jgi:hypothetical protein
MAISPFAGANDDQLTAHIVRLARSERASTADFVACLAEFDGRKLYLGLGFGSIYSYCASRLYLTEGAAYRRIESARTSRRFPSVLEMLRDGRLSLATAALVGPKLTTENAEQLLRDVSFKSKREVELLLARLNPQPPVPSVVRKLPAVKPIGEAPARTEADSKVTPELAGGTSPAVSSAPALPSRRPIVAPLSEAHYKLQVTISAASRERLKHIQDLMRHTIPNGDPAAIVERALELLHDDLLKKKAAAVARPRRTARTAGPAGRHIPSSVKREVWRRDQGRCAFVSPDGHRCGDAGFIEYHHVDAHWLGGEATADNLQLRCRAHNGFEWQRQQDKMLDATV